MSDPFPPEPPSAPQYATPAEVMARLHLAPAHPDAGYVALCTDAGNELVAQWLEHDTREVPLDPPYPSAVRRAAIGAAIRVYRFRDTETSLDESWGTEPIVALPRDPLAGYVDLLAPYRPGTAWSPV